MYRPVVGHALIACMCALVGAACGGAPPRPSAPSCPTERAVVLARQADIARIAGCASLPGVVIRSGATLDTSVLRALATITGDLTIGPTVGTSEAALPALRVVEGAIRVASNGMLQGVFLPRLERARQIDIDGNAALTTLSLPRLARVGGALRITDNASLELVDVSMLTSIGQELVVTGAPLLTVLEAGQLRSAASVQLNVPRVSAEVADRLRATAAAP